MCDSEVPYGILLQLHHIVQLDLNITTSDGPHGRRRPVLATLDLRTVTHSLSHTPHNTAVQEVSDLA